ncbi:MAG TPA: alpha/beta hydrolase [Acidimicrobiales bacterium]|nr:alpha/beta hydrolase [Acidimicrobiales bacterium]
MLTTDEPSSTLTDEAALYHEVSGGGPVALLIAGTPGDSSQFAPLAAAMSSRYTVVTYDRRGTSRSPRPIGWSTTSVAEQADDAAGILMGVTSEPALVYGTSNGAAVALELALRHPKRVRAVLLHELPLLTVLAEPEPVGRMLGQLIGAAMEQGGPAKALDAFLRFAYGGELVDRLDPELREQMYANAEMIFTIEMPGFQTYRPDEAALRSIGVPTRVLVGEDQAVPLFEEAAAWLAERIGTTVVRSPGGHGAHLSHPAELAAFISSHDPPSLRPAGRPRLTNDR